MTVFARRRSLFACRAPTRGAAIAALALLLAGPSLAATPLPEPRPGGPARPADALETPVAEDVPGAPAVTGSVPLPTPSPRAAETGVPEEGEPSDEDELAAAAPPSGETPLPRKRPTPTERRRARAADPALPTPIQVPIKGPIETMTTAAEQACRRALTKAGVEFRPRGQIAEGQCGAELPLEVSAVGGIKFSTPATMRCDAARATADWLTDVVAPAGQRHMNSDVTAVRVAASYHCRTRRGNGRSNRLSEHAMANAIDISAVSFANGETMVVSPKTGETRQKRFQAEIRKGACPIFTTVIGPGTNAAHADHLHLDRAYRSGGYRMCQ